MDPQVDPHDPTKYTDEELLKHCADSHDLLVRTASERWAEARTDLAAAREALYYIGTAGTLDRDRLQQAARAALATKEAP